jgi:hypothetical protein
MLRELTVSSPAFQLVMSTLRAVDEELALRLLPVTSYIARIGPYTKWVNSIQAIKFNYNKPTPANLQLSRKILEEATDEHGLATKVKVYHRETSILTENAATVEPQTLSTWRIKGTKDANLYNRYVAKDELPDGGP